VFLSEGTLALKWWQSLLVAMLLTHFTIISVTIYLHRCQAHRALEWHPVASHLFIFAST
jgi:stearoyl-CoA desaturase (delta-9 desaturase)